MSNYKKLGGYAMAGFMAASALTYAISPRITEREAGLKIVRGKLG